MNHIIIILFVILCLLIIQSLSTKNKSVDKNFTLDIDDNNNMTIYDNKPLHRLALKNKKNYSRVKYNCRTTIVECDQDSDCLNLCAGGESECINGFCAYVYQNEGSLCQNGGTPVSYFYRGYFDYVGCICPPAFIGRFCDIPNKMFTAKK